MDKQLFPKVYAWMFIGLIITFITAYYVSINQAMIENIFNTNLYWILFLIEIGLVIFLSARVMKMQFATAAIFFCIYSFVSGLTFSVFFVLFELSSILFIFALTSLIFGAFSLLGFFTKIDLSKISTVLFMGLIAVIIASIINIFIGSTMFEIIISCITIALFIGITAYDTQKIKRMASQGISQGNLAILGAFELYLDFINIFINLLRIFGNYKN